MDSAACIAESLQSACRDLGFPVPSDRAARYVIGLGLNDAMAHVVPAVPVEEDALDQVAPVELTLWRYAAEARP